MEKSKTNIVIIDDEPPDKSHSLIIELQNIFENVLYFDNPNEGLDYISSNLTKNIIVLLDLAFPQEFPDGHEILKSIREWSFLIPVIIWSAKDEIEEKFSDLINNKTFLFLKKTASIDEILKALMTTEDYIKNSIDIALEEWINAHSAEQKKRPYLVTVVGEKYSLEDILREIRKQTDIGKHFSKNLIKLSIDLLSRNKEKLNA